MVDVGSLVRRVAMVLLYAWVVVVLLAGETANLGCNLMAGLKSASSRRVADAASEAAPVKQVSPLRCALVEMTNLWLVEESRSFALLRMTTPYWCGFYGFGAGGL